MSFKQHYKYIHFCLIGDTKKTLIWECRNNISLDALGSVKWYGPWRQYCFFPNEEAPVVFNGGCLADVTEYLAQVNKAHKVGKGKAA